MTAIQTRASCVQAITLQNRERERERNVQRIVISRIIGMTWPECTLAVFTARIIAPAGFARLIQATIVISHLVISFSVQRACNPPAWSCHRGIILERFRNFRTQGRDERLASTRLRSASLRSAACPTTRQKSRSTGEGSRLVAISKSAGDTVSRCSRWLNSDVNEPTWHLHAANDTTRSWLPAAGDGEGDHWKAIVERRLLINDHDRRSQSPTARTFIGNGSFCSFARLRHSRTGGQLLLANSTSSFATSTSYKPSPPFLDIYVAYLHELLVFFSVICICDFSCTIVYISTFNFRELFNASLVHFTFGVTAD